MAIEKYINDLLYRYDCVIVPNFGGFITNKIGAKINPFSHTFHPPTKQIAFNAHLKQNDGLMVNYIASVENISFEKALAKINTSVASWNESLKNDTLVFENIGALAFNDKKHLILNRLTPRAAETQKNESTFYGKAPCIAETQKNESTFNGKAPCIAET